jgi:UrcA family protein
MEIEMPRPISLVCAAALLFAAGTPSFAQEERREEVVRFADLNLNDSNGADRLIERIHGAAERVCGVRHGPQTSGYRELSRDCTVETTELAVRDVGHPMVLARYYDVNPRVIIEEGSADPYYDDGYVVVRKKPVLK